MEQKEKRALDRCFDSFLHDLDPSPAFVHSLRAEGILTEEQMDKLNTTSSRETKVTMLLRYLPHRGPKAFTIFKDKLERDYPWLAQKLGDELRKLQSSQASINRRLVNVINTQLLPLIHAEVTENETLDHRVHPGQIIEKLGDLLMELETKCYTALNFLSGGNAKTPIHSLIEDRLPQDKPKLSERDVDDLRKDVRSLKRQLKNFDKIKKENERLKAMVELKTNKLKDYHKMVKETKKYKQDIEKYRKETETLKSEITILKQQMCNHISNTTE